ncbi:hypothetical protein ElyMa_006943300 [Elysia marginata]|uniref:Uncharacterized protein n=1 Tax=Elysia marginata TaxID=1093978 RepID=A0AAV4JMH1_9GAST|nr:hypothetical protein ElyMa_006943300 [Elysia marginata]
MYVVVAVVVAAVVVVAAAAVVVVVVVVVVAVVVVVVTAAVPVVIEFMTLPDEVITGELNQGSCSAQTSQVTFIGVPRRSSVPVCLDPQTTQ